MTPILCPTCLVLLAEGVTSWDCPGCGVSYRSLRGIPDLRVADDGYLPNAEDWSLALALDAAYDDLDFLGLLSLLLDLGPPLKPELKARQINHILTAGPRARAWVEAIGAGSGAWLDLGCGSGSFLASRAAEGTDLVGIDVAMRWLLVARKRLDEEGALARSSRLVCGNAERLPFADQTFAAVIAGDVIEHVASQRDTLAESYRVLIPGGRCILATPNRTSLAPEPHVGLWGVGFLPRAWMGRYVAARGRGDFRAILTRTAGGWLRLLAASPFRGGTLRAPRLTESDLAAMPGLKRRLGRAYNAAVSTRVGRAIALRVGPLLHLVATRPDATPTPPPSTTPSGG